MRMLIVTAIAVVILDAGAASQIRQPRTHRLQTTPATVAYGCIFHPSSARLP